MKYRLLISLLILTVILGVVGVAPQALAQEATDDTIEAEATAETTEEDTATVSEVSDEPVLQPGEINDISQDFATAKWFVISLIMLVAFLLLAFGYYFLSEKPKR